MVVASVDESGRGRCRRGRDDGNRGRGCEEANSGRAGRACGGEAVGARPGVVDVAAPGRGGRFPVLGGAPPPSRSPAAGATFAPLPANLFATRQPVLTPSAPDPNPHQRYVFSRMSPRCAMLACRRASALAARRARALPAAGRHGPGARSSRPAASVNATPCAALAAAAAGALALQAARPRTPRTPTTRQTTRRRPTPSASSTGRGRAGSTGCRSSGA